MALAICLFLSQAWIVPTLGQVTVSWSYQTGSASVDRVYGMAVDPTTKDVVIGGPAEGAVNGQAFVGSRNWVAVKLDTNGAAQWTYQAGEVGSWSQINDVAIDGSSNVFLVGPHQGTLFGTSYGNTDLAVVKLNSAGVLQWSFQQGSTAQDSATCVGLDSSGNVIVGGWVRGTIAGETFGGAMDDAVLLKLNSAGVQQWLMQTEFGTSGRDYIQDLTVDGSDNILVIGTTQGAFGSNTNAGSNDVFIVKTDTAGVFQWSYQLGTTASESGTAIGLLPGGDIIGAGYTYGSLPGHTNAGAAADGFIVKVNAAGVQQWVVQIGTATNSNEMIYGLAVHPSSGNFAIYGDTTGDFNGDTNAGGNDFWAAEYDTAGALQWSYQYGTASGGESLSGGEYDSAGDLILAGEAPNQFYSNTHQGVTDMIALKLAPPSSTSTSKTTTSTSTASSTSSTTSATTSSSTRTSSSSTSSTSISSSSTSLTSTSSRSTSSSSTSSSSTSTSSTSTSSTSSSTSTTTTSSATSTSSTTSSTSSMTTSSSISTTTTLPGSPDPGSPDPTLDPGTSPGSTTTTTTTTTSTSTTGTVRLTRTEIRAMEVQRRAKAAATVAKLQVAEATALELVVPQLNSSQQLPVVPVETELGMLNATMLYVGQLELLGGVIIYAEGGEGVAFVKVSAVTVEEILVSDGLTREDPLLLSVVAMNDTTNFEQDAITGEASFLSSLATLSINVWRSDGTRIAVNSLENPLQFTLEVTDADVSCAFWDEDVAKWSADGVTTIASTNSSLACSTRHLTIFAGIKDVFLKNVVLAFTCSTLSGLFTEPAFANLLITNWLWSTPSILNMVFHGLGVVCVLLAWCYDRKQVRVVPWTEREVILMRVKEDEKTESKEEEEDLDDGDAPPPSRCTRCMDCFNHSMEYVSHATGGDATVEAVKELAGNADVAAVNRAISTLQSHKAGISRAQIAVFNQQNTKKAVELQRSMSNLQTNRPNLRRSATTASEVLVKTADHGQVAAEAFLRRGFLCRVATLWPAAHPWSKAVHFSMLAPVRASVALVVLKITSAGALSAVFFSSSSPGPDSDPECKPPRSPIAQAVQSLTVGLITALLSDVIVSILFAMQVKKVVFSKTEWTEEKKRRQHFRWNMWTIIFWLIVFLYGGFCNLYICLFFANVTDQDRLDWLHSMGVAMLDDLLVKSFLAAFAMATIATLVLCCRPRVVEKIEAKWIKDGKEETNEAVNSNNEAEEPKDGTASTEIETPEFPSPKEVEGTDTTSDPDANAKVAAGKSEVLHVKLDMDPMDPEVEEAEEVEGDAEAAEAPPEIHEVDEMDASCETLHEETV